MKKSESPSIQWVNVNKTRIVIIIKANRQKVFKTA